MWPPVPEYICQGDIKIPELLHLFLLNLFTAESPVPKRVHRLVKSMVQSMIYCVKTVKHTQLGIFVKKKPECKQVVEALNQLGHCILYYEINALETGYTENQVNHQLSRTYIPTGNQPSTFVTFILTSVTTNLLWSLKRDRACFDQGVLVIQATVECGFTQKRICGMIRTYSQKLSTHNTNQSFGQFGQMV